MVKFYIGTGLENIAAHNAYRDALVSRGFEITYDWTLHGSLQDSPNLWESHAKYELDGVIAADVVIILLPGGRGTHAELGAALAANRQVIIVGPHERLGDCERMCIFYQHPNVVVAQGVTNVTSSDTIEFVAHIINSCVA